MESGEGSEERPLGLEETPTWAVATVISMLVTAGILLHSCLKKSGNWLKKKERKPLLAALEKVKDELMIFGLLSLLMGHWAVYVAKICVQSSELSNRFDLCAPVRTVASSSSVHHHFVTMRIDNSENASSSSNLQMPHRHHHNHCPKGRKPLASYKSLEQLHRFLFVLGTTHVLYSFTSVALAVGRIYSWRLWESYAISLAAQGSLSTELLLAALVFIFPYPFLALTSRFSFLSYLDPDSEEETERMKHLSSFVSRHTSHPWSHHTVLVWLFCFGRQFWSSIDEADYLSMRQGFITTHQLPLSYNFHNYMFRSMEEEFENIVGISVQLWIFTILCVLLGFHGTNLYFWLSFCPAILVLLIGTKLHLVIVKLAAEIAETNPQAGKYKYNPRDEFFWFGNPRLLLKLIHFLTFQNALEMATYLWSLWEIQGPSCFTENHAFAIIRLTFGLVTQFWCSFITFPLYVIVAQMGSKYKKFIISEGVRKSIHGWRNKASDRHEQSKREITSLESLLYFDDNVAFGSSSSNSLVDRYSI